MMPGMTEGRRSGNGEEGGIKQGILVLDGFPARLGGGLAVRGSAGRRRGARRGGGSSPRRAEGWVM
jgi:hypothetical protein